MVLHDDPIQRKEQDSLERNSVAERIAGMIMRYSGKESFVIAIEGPWGSGKTSFINLLLTHLHDDTTTYFTFNPWNFSDEASLMGDFFARFSEAIKKATGTEKKNLTRLAEYASRLSESDIPYTGAIKVFIPNKSLDDSRKELDKMLGRAAKKIVVIIDDIDRLDKKDTKLILKLVKLTANFPNTIFILSYDRERVEKRITEEGLDGSEYLKKIVQVSFSLPLPDEQELWVILFEYINIIIAKIYGDNNLNPEEERRWDRVFNGGIVSKRGLGKLFTTIRDIKRYASSLELTWSIIEKEDVNRVDFLAIEAIRVFAPNFYNAIPTNKDLFTQEIGLYGINPAASAKAQQERYEELLESLVPKNVQESVDGICKEIFPVLNPNPMGSTSYEESERNKRICSATRFDFYFQLGVPFGEISEIKVDEVIQLLDVKENFYKALLEFKERKLLKKILDKITLRIGTLDVEKTKSALSAMFDLEKVVEKDLVENSFDLSSTHRQITEFGLYSIKTLDPSIRKEFLLEILSPPSLGLYYPIRLVYALEESLKRNPDLLKPEEIKELQKLMLDHIERTQNENKLEEQKYLAAILFRWREWKSTEPEVVSNFIKSLISTQKGLLCFLKSFIGKTYSSSGNYNSMDFNSIGDLYPLEAIQGLVEAITKEDFDKMSVEEKEIITLFKNKGQFLSR